IRFSTRRELPWPTTRKLQVRLSLPQATAVGAQEPLASRLYQLTVGAKKSMNSRRQAIWPATKCSKVAEKPWLSGNTGPPSSPRKDRWMWQELPSRSSNFGIKEIEHPSWAAISLAPFLYMEWPSAVASARSNLKLISCCPKL